jgi:hypothetical protein
VIVFVAEVGEQETGQRSSFCGAGTVPRRFLFCRLELQCMIMNAMFPFAAPLLTKEFQGGAICAAADSYVLHRAVRVLCVLRLL